MRSIWVVSTRFLRDEIQPASKRNRSAHRRPFLDSSVLIQILVASALEIIATLKRALAEITGMDAVTPRPAAGAHGELTGIFLARAFLESRGNPRKRALVPGSAHGANTATVQMAGYEVANVVSNERGMVNIEALKGMVDEDAAAMMLTNPNTLGVCEEEILEIGRILHAKGALPYMDGANMNALTGIARLGHFGVDAMHLNLHKTFSTPHGGSGNGAGPVAAKKFLEPFLPLPRLERSDAGLRWDYDLLQSIGRVRAFYGNFGVLVRALAYIMAHGGDGLRRATLDALLKPTTLASAHDARMRVQRPPPGRTWPEHGLSPSS